jgi:hypothetical protein
MAALSGRISTRDNTTNEEEHWAKKAFDSEVGFRLYARPEWQHAPDNEDEEARIGGWGQCVKAWRFASCGSNNGRLMFAIEIEQNNMASHRHLLFADQVKNVLAKTDAYPTLGYPRVEEVIINIHQHTGWCYTPDPVVLMFVGPTNALAFQMALVEFLGNW